MILNTFIVNGRFIDLAIPTTGDDRPKKSQVRQFVRERVEKALKSHCTLLWGSGMLKHVHSNVFEWEKG
jgi:hypothetical protein